MQAGLVPSAGIISLFNMNIFTRIKA